MAVVGMMSVSGFSMAPDSVRSLSCWCDRIVLRRETRCGCNRKLVRQCVDAATCEVAVFDAKVLWGAWRYRQEMLDEVMRGGLETGDICLTPDTDERFSDDFGVDLERLRDSDANGLMFMFQMVTRDGRAVRVYPARPHCKAWKWEPGVSFQPYRGFARPTYPWFRERQPVYLDAQTKILHYCSYTPSLEAKAVKRDAKKLGPVASSLVG